MVDMIEPQFFPGKEKKDETPQFQYNGYMVVDDGETIRIGVVTPDGQKGRIVLPWEEVDTIRKVSYDNRQRKAEEKMKGKRVHCRFLQSFHAFMAPCCQLGKDNGLENENCLTCKYIDGYIENYDPFGKIESVPVIVHAETESK